MFSVTVNVFSRTQQQNFSQIDIFIDIQVYTRFLTVSTYFEHYKFSTG